MLNEVVVKKLIGAVDSGLVRGLGKQAPGEMCVEAAVCYAFGWQHGDKPACVHTDLSNFGIRINDANFSSDAVRAKAMRAFSVAQLGTSTGFDIETFGVKMYIWVTKNVTGPLFDRLGHLAPHGSSESFKCFEVAQSAIKVETFEEAKRAQKLAAAAATTAYATATTAYATAAYATATAAAAAYATAAYATATAAAAAYATAATTAYAWPDEILTKFMAYAVEVLVEMETEGSKWLWLLDDDAKIEDPQFVTRTVGVCC